MIFFIFPQYNVVWTDCGRLLRSPENLPFNYMSEDSFFSADKKSIVDEG